MLLKWKNCVSQEAKMSEIDREIGELRARLMRAHKALRLERRMKPNLAKKIRKKGGVKKAGWKADSLGYRGCKIDHRIWGSKSTEYGALSCWIEVAEWEIHLVKMVTKNFVYWRGTAWRGGTTIVSRKVKMPRQTSDAKALNEMFRERLKVTFKI